MKIELKQIKVRDIVSGYTNNEEEGVTGFNGSLNIRPPYQREFVYKDKQQKAVISTIVRGFPLNTMYWVKNEDDSFELLDGQHILSLINFLPLSQEESCKRLSTDGSLDDMYDIHLDYRSANLKNYLRNL